MATYSSQELLHKWALGELTAEQAIGQLLQYQARLLQQQADLEKRIRLLEQRLNLSA